MSGPVLLVLDSEQESRAFLKRALSQLGYSVFAVATEQAALSLATQRRPDLVVLALATIHPHAKERVARFRHGCSAPILLLTTATTEQQGWHALEAGADDYLSKPCTRAELSRRVRLTLLDGDQAHPPRRSWYAVGELQIDLASQLVQLGNRPIKLTPKEYHVLACLAARAGHVVTHRRLLREVWGPRRMDDTQYLRVFVAQLRRKLEADPDRPRYLLTERRLGYRLACSDQ